MSETGITISQLLDVAADDLKDTLQEHVRAHAAHADFPATLLGFVAEEAAEAVAAQLRLDVFELVFKAWAAVDELREYADPAKHPPGESAVVHWGKCRIRAPQAIDIRLGFAGISLPVLRLTLALEAEFHSLALTIRDGAIRKLSPGTASASVALKYGDATLIQPCRTPEIAFRHGIEFEEGLRIA